MADPIKDALRAAAALKPADASHWRGEELAALFVAEFLRGMAAAAEAEAAWIKARPYRMLAELVEAARDG